MTNELCPKCGAGEYIPIPGPRPSFLGGPNVTAWRGGPEVKVKRLVCAHCGYVQEWVDTADLAKMRDMYGVSHNHSAPAVKG